MPVVDECFNGSFVIEARPDVVPAEADTTQYDGVALLVAELCSLHLQLSPLLHGVERLGTDT